MMPDIHEPNLRAVIGGNLPPAEATPYELAKKRIEDLYEEAKLWLDGAVVDSTDLADGIKNLRDMIKAAEKEADEARKAENKVFDDGKAEVQARFNLLIGDTKSVQGLTVKALKAINKALEPWLIAEAARIEAEAAEKRRIADEAIAKAQEALRGSDAANLTERDAAEELLGEAKSLERAASRAEKSKASVSGNLGGRSVSLRKVYSGTFIPANAEAGIEDGRVLALRHFCKTKPVEVSDFIMGLVSDHLRFGDHGPDEIPGVLISYEMKL